MNAGFDDRVSEDAEAGVSSTFTPPPDSGTEADAPLQEAPKLCIATECPAPYATCDFAGDRCNSNLSNDINNCGACGNKCPSEIYQSSVGGVTVDVRHLASRCVSGQCTVECNNNDYADCNGVLDDGCETSLKGNHDNCGGCGIKCADDEPCVVNQKTGQSKCGCPKGTTWCEAQATCAALDSDDSNCGVCGNKCPTASPDAGPRPPNTKYGCFGGTCAEDDSHLKCVNDFTGQFADCDDDLHKPDSNGCEINLNFKLDTSTGVYMYLADPNNCGACGNKCADGQICALLREGGIQCACPGGTSLCASNRATWCADLLTSPLDCGACGNACKSDPSKNLGGVCKKGMCVDECVPGWGDCDGNPDNGCETNLQTNIANCGACGNRCDTAAGQPCIAGQCLMADCDAGVITK